MGIVFAPMPYAYVIVLPTGTVIPDASKVKPGEPPPPKRFDAWLVWQDQGAPPCHQAAGKVAQTQPHGTQLITTDVGTCDGYTCDLELVLVTAGQAMSPPAPQLLPTLPEEPAPEPAA
jgi:hypothetical protein